MCRLRIFSVIGNCLIFNSMNNEYPNTSKHRMIIKSPNVSREHVELVEDEIKQNKKYINDYNLKG